MNRDQYDREMGKYKFDDSRVTRVPANDIKRGDLVFHPTMTYLRPGRCARLETVTVGYTTIVFSDKARITSSPDTIFPVIRKEQV